LSLLAAAWPERSAEEWATVAIGERDEYLLRLREALFGHQLEGLAACPQCGEQLELAFATADIRAPVAAGADNAQAIRIEVSGYDLVCRLPNSLDLMASAQAADEERRASLLQRCIVSARRDGSDVGPQQLPEEVIGTVADTLAEADPQAAVELSLTCPACQHRWLMAFDILSYLWGEIEDWAQRLLLDIHALASAYGWSERDILALTPRRRRLYLDLLGT
jgi:hypothetical protein